MLEFVWFILLYFTTIYYCWRNWNSFFVSYPLLTSSNLFYSHHFCISHHCYHTFIAPVSEVHCSQFQSFIPFSFKVSLLPVLEFHSLQFHIFIAPSFRVSLLPVSEFHCSSIRVSLLPVSGFHRSQFQSFIAFSFKVSLLPVSEFHWSQFQSFIAPVLEFHCSSFKVPLLQFRSSIASF